MKRLIRPIYAKFAVASLLALFLATWHSHTDFASSWTAGLIAVIGLAIGLVAAGLAAAHMVDRFVHPGAGKANGVADYSNAHKANEGQQ